MFVSCTFNGAVIYSMILYAVYSGRDRKMFMDMITACLIHMMGVPVPQTLNF
jgi:hypothetical protein